MGTKLRQDEVNISSSVLNYLRLGRLISRFDLRVGGMTEKQISGHHFGHGPALLVSP